MSEPLDWMRPTLATMFESIDIEHARAALTSDERRVALRVELNQDADRTGHIPAGQYADNLLQGLLVLRIKFDRSEAMRKLERNLEMRSERRAQP